MVITVLIFIVILGSLVFVHELGHFLMARRNKVPVEEFGFGFPPRIWGIKKGGTMYSINWIPLGGFVKIFGEDGDKNNDPKSFFNQSLKARGKIIIAGVAMNLLAASLIISLAAMIGLPEVVTEENQGIATEQKIQIMTVAENSPAKPILKVGDVISEVDDQSFNQEQEVVTYLQSRGGQEVKFDVKRGDQLIEAKLIPRDNPPPGEGAVGIGLVKTGLVKYPWYKAIGTGIVSTVTLIGLIIGAFFTLIKDLLIEHQVNGEIAGPVGIAVLTGQVYEMGLVYLLQFAAFLSINLAVINILPFPALDGGRLLFIIIEKFRGKRVSPRFEAVVHTTGFFILIALIIVITFWDIGKFSGNFSNWWDKLTN